MWDVEWVGKQNQAANFRNHKSSTPKGLTSLLVSLVCLFNRVSLRRLTASGRRILEINAMSFVQLELEALKILTALKDMNTDKATTALAAAHALAYALADAAEAGDRAAKLAA